MAEPSDLEERPSKRARLDEASTGPEPASTGASRAPQTPPPSSTAPSKAPITPATIIDSDLDREIRAGITEYVSPDNLGFTGVLKQRYTDFLVNEIGLDGEVLHLRSTGVEKKKDVYNRTSNEAEVAQERKAEVKSASGNTRAEMADAKAENEADDQPDEKVEDGEGGPEVNKISEDDLEALNSIFGEEATLQILSLVRAIRKHSQWKAKDFKIVIGPVISDKEQRTNAHQTLRRIFPNLLESSMEPDQSIRIKARPPADRGNKKKKGKDRNRDPDRHRGQLAWEELGGEYLHFSLYKENKDTMEVVGFLGSVTGAGAKGFGFAGTKDRRACTVQRVCAKRQTAERMAGIGKKLFNAAIGDFEYKHHDIGLGDLKGNEFVVTLRDCHFQNEAGLDFAPRVQLAKDVVSQAVEDFSEKGFINYYGLQRFGSFSASTDAIGIKLLQGDLKGAVDDILAYSKVALAASEAKEEEDPTVLVSQDDKARAKALNAWKSSSNGQEALRLLPKKFTAERNIIQHLSSKNSRTKMYDRAEDWQGALMTIPRNLRLMYVHAYQSLVWNVVAGKRWSMFGDKVIEGDLVLVHEHKDKELNGASTHQDTVDQDGEIIINPAGADSAIKEDEFERARPLSKDEAESGKYTIFDIVLPQPGFDVEYPRNAIGDFYKKFMGSERGGGLDPYNMRRKWREVSLSGGYRKFLARPLKEMEWEVREYAKVDEQLVETDLQRLKNGKEGVQDSTSNAVGEGSEPMDVEEGEEVQDKKLAVIFKLQLGSSQYATIALRELMKAGGVKAFKPEFIGGR